MSLETIALFIFVVLIFTATYAGFSGAPWMPTNGRDIKEAVKMSKVKKGQKVYDLGSGDGRLLFEAAKKGAVVKGFEISLIPYIFSSIKRLFQKEKENIKISYKNFWKANLGDADIIYFFLMPANYSKIRKKMEKELKKGTKVVVYVWPIKEWEPVSKRVEKGKENIFMYEM